MKTAYPNKAEVARCQLGTALHLWLHDLDPYSTHVLACGGSEVAEALALECGGEALEQWLWDDVGGDKGAEKDLRARRTYRWNTLKHGNRKDKELLPQDEVFLSLDWDCDSDNEGRLFAGWFSLIQTGVPMPLPAQLFLHWYLAKSKGSVEDELILSEFKGIRGMAPAEQKALLLRVIADATRVSKLLEALGHKLDQRPLIIPRF